MMLAILQSSLFDMTLVPEDTLEYIGQWAVRSLGSERGNDTFAAQLGNLLASRSGITSRVGRSRMRSDPKSIISCSDCHPHKLDADMSSMPFSAELTVFKRRAPNVDSLQFAFNTL